MILSDRMMLYAGFGKVVKERADDALALAFCWTHARRGFYEFHQATQSPIAAEALARIARLYAIEAEIRGQSAERRLAMRRERSRTEIEAMHAWLDEQLPRISKGSELAKAMRYVMRHWEGLTRFLDDGRIELDTNTVEREIRRIPLGRKNALFAGNDTGAEHWALMATLIGSAKLSGVQPLAGSPKSSNALSPAIPRPTKSTPCCPGTGKLRPLYQPQRSARSPKQDRHSDCAYSPSTPSPTESAISSNAPSAGSRTGAPSPHDMTKPHEISSLVFASSSPSHLGSVESRA